MEHTSLQEKMKGIAWGFVLLHIDINLGTIGILPAWLGYVFMLGALPVLAEYVPSALLLRPLAKALVLYKGLTWGFQIFGIAFDVGIVNTIVFALELYFHFQFLTNIAEVGNLFAYPKEKKLLQLRTVRTLLLVGLALSFMWAKIPYVTLGILVVQVAIAVWICSVLFEFADFLASAEKEEMLE